MFRSITLAAAILTASSALTTAAFARPPAVANDDSRSTIVSYVDLDLSNPMGVRTLEHRLHGAAVLVCGPAPTPYELGESSSFRTCVADAQARARRDLQQDLAAANRTIAPFRVARNDR